MHTIKCRCGKSSKNFVHNIGDFFINVCCLQAGYDHKGNLINPLKKEEAKEKSETTSIAELLMKRSKEKDKE